MAIVVEHIDKSGHVLRWDKFAHDRVAIGRAFDNDIILADPGVDAHHGVITWDDEAGHLQVEDLNALNGLWALDAKGKKTRLSAHSELFSGQRLLLGKTLLRIYHSGHPVPAAKHARLDEAITGFFSHILVVLVLAASAVGLDLWNQYIDHPTGQHFAEFGREALYGVLGVAVYSSFWAILGKSLLQDGRFWFHLSLSYLVLIIWMCWEFFMPWIAFNLQLSATVMGWSGKILASVLTGGAIYISCVYATRLGSRPRLAIAAILPLILMMPLVIKLFDKREFSARPDYSHVLIPPASQWRNPGNVDDFMSKAETAYKTYDPAQDNTDEDNIDKDSADTEGQEDSFPEGNNSAEGDAQPGNPPTSFNHRRNPL